MNIIELLDYTDEQIDILEDITGGLRDCKYKQCNSLQLNLIIYKEFRSYLKRVKPNDIKLIQDDAFMTTINNIIIICNDYKKAFTVGVTLGELMTLTNS